MRSPMIQLLRWMKIFFQTKYKWKHNTAPFKVEDQNLDYGVVYEANERSKATDRNQDYDYDYMQ